MGMKWHKSDRNKRHVEYRRQHYAYVAITKPRGAPLYVTKHGVSQEKVMKSSPTSRKPVSLAEVKLPPAYDD